MLVSLIKHNFRHDWQDFAKKGPSIIMGSYKSILMSYYADKRLARELPKNISNLIFKASLILYGLLKISNINGK